MRPRLSCLCLLLAKRPAGRRTRAISACRRPPVRRTPSCRRHRARRTRFCRRNPGSAICRASAVHSARATCRPRLSQNPPPRAGEIGVMGSLSPTTPSRSKAMSSTRSTEIAPALRRCWHPPVHRRAQYGAMATVRFSLRRDGSLFGQPRVTWETRRSDPEPAGALHRLGRRRCSRLHTDEVVAELGASIAGRPFSIRFHGRAPSNERQI
jgi:hypothetical protein